MRRSLCLPVSAIFVAANKLLEAATLHRLGDSFGAEQRLRESNCEEVRAFTEKAWGKGSAARHGFQTVAGAPTHLAIKDRPKPRMPTAATCRSVIARDGHHCRFCGIPVIDPLIRRKLIELYPRAVQWGGTNASQHAAFQCMWRQFDHILPNSRGGDSSLENVVIACAACNFGRMEATLEEAQLQHPLAGSAPITWEHHSAWDGLEYFRTTSRV